MRTPRQSKRTKRTVPGIAVQRARAMCELRADVASDTRRACAICTRRRIEHQSQSSATPLTFANLIRRTAVLLQVVVTEASLCEHARVHRRCVCSVANES